MRLTTFFAILLCMDTNRTTILVIENHPIMREALNTAIAAEPDLDVAKTSNSDIQAFKLSLSEKHDIFFLGSKPDIVLLALGNPGEDDLQTLRTLQKQLLGTPILALTSNEVPEQEQAALAYGASAVLTKAASRSELLDTLRSIRETSALFYAK